jgi:hypothetical protein
MKKERRKKKEKEERKKERERELSHPYHFTLMFSIHTTTRVIVYQQNFIKQARRKEEHILE